MTKESAVKLSDQEKAELMASRWAKQPNVRRVVRLKGAGYVQLDFSDGDVKATRWTPPTA
jgi:hypothetical protein